MTDPTPAEYAGPRRILSGIQASGALHLGNYLGALKRFTQLQDTGAPCFLFVADLHAITVWQDPALLTAQTREIAAEFNNDFGVPGFFPLPEPLTQGPAPRVMSLRDGAAKMSKSDPSDQSRINLTDDADSIVAKVRKAKTDPEPLPETVEGLDARPEAKNLVTIYAALADMSREQVLAQFGGQGFGAFKPALADLAVASMAPVTAEMRRLMDDPAEIDRVLKDGAERASAIADPVVDEVKKIVGFWRA